MKPVTSEWRGPRWSLVRLLRGYIDARRIEHARNRNRPRRKNSYSNAPFSERILTQRMIDGGER